MATNVKWSGLVNDSKTYQQSYSLAWLLTNHDSPSVTMTNHHQNFSGHHSFRSEAAPELQVVPSSIEVLRPALGHGEWTTIRPRPHHPRARSMARILHSRLTEPSGWDFCTQSLLFFYMLWTYWRLFPWTSYFNLASCRQLHNNNKQQTNEPQVLTEPAGAFTMDLP